MLLYQVTADDEVGFTEEALAARLADEGLEEVIFQFDRHGHVNLVSSSLRDLGEAALILADDDVRLALYTLQDAEAFSEEKLTQDET